MHWFDTYFVHVLTGNGYQFWSGIGSDVGEITLLGIVLLWWRQHNCHVHKCWRISWHPHPIHGHPVCRHHYPDHKNAAPAGHDVGAHLGRRSAQEPPM
jgi:hypothetical protein